MVAVLRTRPAVLVLLAALVLLGIAGVSSAATAPADFGLGISPTSQSVPQGAAATYTVTATGTGGFAGSVVYSVSGLPTGVVSGFSVSSTTLSGAAASGSSTLRLATTTSTPTGAYPLTITGTSGNAKRSVSVGLTVTRALDGSFTVTANPASVSVAPGSTAVYNVDVAASARFAGNVSLSPSRALPAGTTATVHPTSVTVSASSPATSTLQISTTGGSAATPDGTYTVDVVGASTDLAGTSTSQYARIELVVDSKLSNKPFTISGGSPIKPLAPGVDKQPLDLALSNANHQGLSVTNISVAVSGTSSTACGASNFAVTQYRGPYPISVPKTSRATLSDLGVQPSQMPQLQMLDLASNQDSCKGVTVTLSYSGSATGN